MSARLQTGLRKPRAASSWEKERYYFDEAAAELWTEVFPIFFKHIAGDQYGQPFMLMPFWLDIFLRFFCWKDKKTHRRRYRDGFIFIPRKNAKTTTLAAVGLALLMICEIRRGQVFIIASDEEQAGIMFNMMKAFIDDSELLQEQFEIFHNYIEHRETGAQVRALTSSQTGKTGLKPDMVVIDEYQEQKDTNMEMLMKGGAVANKEPVCIKIGTMGKEDETSRMPWQSALEHARKVIKDPSLAPTLLPIVFECTQDDDPGDPELWKAVNPGYGISVDEISFQALWDEVKDDPEKRQSFCQYNLNMPVRVASEYVDINRWEALKEDFDLVSLAKQECFGGLDLADTDDMVALSLCFPKWQQVTIKDSVTGAEEKIMHPTLRYLVFYWVPEKAILLSEKKPFSYRPHVTSGIIRSCGVHAINWTQLRKELLEIFGCVRLRELGVDPYRAGELTEYLVKRKVKVVYLPQSFKELDLPTRQFKDFINEGDILHNGNPVTLWNLRNARIVSNKNANMMLSKKHSAGKIDGIAASINAMRMFMDAGPPKPKQELITF